MRLQAAAFPVPELDAVNPVWFKAALAPYAASLIENRPVDVAALVRGFHDLKADGRWDHILVEGAGDWETPLAKGMTVAHLARQLALPIVLVVNNRLGAINHTLLTLAAIAASGLTCQGIILNYVSEERDSASISNGTLLREFSNVPILGELMHGEDFVLWD